MTKINSSDLPPPEIVAPACAKYHAPLSKKRRKKRPVADTEAIGTPSYNLLLDLLKCQAKHPNVGGGGGAGGGGKKCAGESKTYAACHAAVMGVGNYEGRKNCAEEMDALFECANPGAASS